ncbi:MAG: transposase, partial [bacterium]|nr:transposase [bacterium]
RSIKAECLNKIIPFGFTTLERSVNEFVTHYNLHRPHQGIGNELTAGSKDSGTGEVITDERLGGLQMHYHRAAA